MKYLTQQNVVDGTFNLESMWLQDLRPDKTLIEGSANKEATESRVPIG